MTIDINTLISAGALAGGLIGVYVRLRTKINELEVQVGINSSYRKESAPDRNKALETLVQLTSTMDSLAKTLNEIKTDIHEIKNDIENVYAANPTLKKPLK